MATPIVYIGHDNPIDLVLRILEADGDTTFVDADSNTRYVLDCGAVELDSDILGFSEGGIFDLSMLVEVGAETVRALRLRLGLYEQLVAGKYSARLIGYNATWPEGLVWEDKFSFKVVS